jgi:hypothetical protein
MTDSMSTVSPDLLMWVANQMKGNILDFGTGKRDITARNGAATVEIAIGLLRRVEQVAVERGMDPTGSEWGPNVEGIISASGLDSHHFGR